VLCSWGGWAGLGVLRGAGVGVALPGKLDGMARGSVSVATEMCAV
jgi:hypothetical protein